MRLDDLHIFAGMQRDIIPTQHESKYLWDAHNIRITTRDSDNVILSLSNERGTLKLNGDSITGVYLGHCVVGDKIVVFTTSSATPKPITNPDRIYLISSIVNSGYTVNLLYSGNLHFDLNHYIDAFALIETEDIKKVYWIDGINIPRLLILDHIKYSSYSESTFADTQFDFIPTLELGESISIEKIFKSGMFSAGTIQYAFTYYNKYGRQSNIFYTSLLEYISFLDRGGSPEESVTNSFKITISNWQEGFDYIRVYSIQRTSIDSTPICRIVTDIDLNNVSGTSITVIDTGEKGEAIDPAELLYVGGLGLKPKTWAIKNNTLFMGNMELSVPDITSVKVSSTPISEAVQDNSVIEVTSDYRDPVDIDNHAIVNNVLYDNVKPGFKCGEHYRLGIQAQYKDGTWSHPLWIKDYIVNNRSYIIKNIEAGVTTSRQLYTNIIKYTLNPTIIASLYSAGYRKIRAVCCYPDVTDRLILTQGILNPTVRRTLDAVSIEGIKQTENWSSWYFRPSYLNHHNPVRLTDPPEFIHGNNLRSEFSLDIDTDTYSSFSVDQTFVTMNSPELEFDDRIGMVKARVYKLKIVGYTPFKHTYYDKLLETSTPPAEDGTGVSTIYNNYTLGQPYWVDNLWEQDDDAYDNSGSSPYNHYTVNYMVYPWHRTGSLNNDVMTSRNVRTALLKKKVQSRLLYAFNSEYPDWFEIDEYNLKDCKYISGDQATIEFIRDTSTLINNLEVFSYRYKWNLDTVLGGDYDIHLTPSNAPKVLPTEGYENDLINTLTDYEEKLAQQAGGSPSIFIGDKKALIPVKYKSTPHLALLLRKSLPRFSNFQGCNKPSDSSDDPEGGGNSNSKFVPYIFYNKYYEHSDGTAFPSEGSDNYLSIENSNYNPVYGITIEYNVGSRIISSSPTTTWEDRNATGQSREYNRNLFSQLKADDYIVIGLFDGEGTTDYLVKVSVVNNGPGANNLLYYTIANPVVNADGNSITVKYYHPSNDASFYTTATFVRESNGRYKKTAVPVENDPVTPASYEPVIEYPQQETPIEEVSDAHLFLGELVREGDINTDFGGVSDFAIQHNLWIPASKSVTIIPNGQYTDIALTEGDTWYQRYNCLKTYPFTLEDENQLIELASYYCESRINLGGIYDKLPLAPHLFITKEVFNNYNPVYTQKDNFFSYRIFDDDLYDRDSFDNTITWGKEHQDASDIDYFTNIVLGSTLSMNSNYGGITKLINYNDLLLCFQPDCISKINYNEKVQLTTQEGVPVELANSGKVDGWSLISTDYGSTNKDTILKTDVGLFFIDDRRKGLMALGDKGEVKDISMSLNFRNWFVDNDFSPLLRNNIGWLKGAILFDDYIRNDLYLLLGNVGAEETCLMYSKRLGQFTSFMSYKNVDSIFNLTNKTYALKSDYLHNKVDIYQMYAGDYNNYFGTTHPFDFSFISNAIPTNDKIFANVEVRGAFSNNAFLNYIEAENEYQHTGVCTTHFPAYNYSEHFTAAGTKKKFRIWRIDIPRALDGQKRTLNRMRNTWLKIKLGMSNPGDTKAEIYDVNVLYHMFDIPSKQKEV